MDTILIVEDDYELQDTINEILIVNGYRTIIVNNGIEAIDVLEEQIVDLILSDIVMPKMNGYQLLQEIRNRPHLTDIPFVFFSVKCNKDEIRKGMRMGADDYLPKPFKSTDLIASINVRLKKKKLFESERHRQKNSLFNRLIPELRTPLTPIVGFAEMLRDGFYDSRTDEHMLITNSISKSAERLLSLIDKIVFFIEVEELLCNKEALKLILNNSTNISSDFFRVNFKEYLAKRNCLQTADIELENATLNIDENYLIKIIYELLENSIEYSEPATPIKVDGVRELGMYKLTLTNISEISWCNGIDLHLSDLQKLYPVSRGAGLGLILVRDILRIFSGEVTFTTRENNRVSVVIAIPISDEYQCN